MPTPGARHLLLVVVSTKMEPTQESSSTQPQKAYVGADGRGGRVKVQRHPNGPNQSFAKKRSEL